MSSPMNIYNHLNDNFFNSTLTILCIDIAELDLIINNIASLYTPESLTVSFSSYDDWEVHSLQCLLRHLFISPFFVSNFR